jgi:hypothetical protein
MYFFDRLIKTKTSKKMNISDSFFRQLQSNLPYPYRWIESLKIRYNFDFKSSQQKNVLSGARSANFKGIIHDLTFILLRGNWLGRYVKNIRLNL